MSGVFKDSHTWLQLLKENSGPLARELREIYGDSALVEEKRKDFLRLLQRFHRVYGHAEELLLVRSPCRINLMGVHVEHRRGEVNYVTHYREMLIAAQPRNDDVVRLHDLESRRFGPREFSIREEIRRGPFRSWECYIDSQGVKASLKSKKGDWSNYVKASVLRLCNRFPRRKPRGMNIMVSGDIPVSSGLSSSSAIVVASAMAFMLVNDLEVRPGELVVLCGEGEWYVGTRGGAGDHAAMIFGRRNNIAHLRFFPFQLLEYVPLPPGHSIVIVNSLKQAHKSGAVLSAYNETIAAYATALMLIKQILVDDMGFDRRLVNRKLVHLGDINLHRDIFPDHVIYEILLHMPQLITRDELLARLPRRRGELQKVFDTHEPPALGYRSRPVAMFGLSEIARGHGCVELLKKNDLRGFGRLMFVSHDGDRVVTWLPSGRKKTWNNEKARVTDAYLRRLKQNLHSNDPRKVRAARLMFQPGGFRCSSEELDQIVDVSKRVPGVVGAGLTGAGFGGCVLVLLKDACVDALLNALQEQYYGPRGLPFAAEVCASVGGAGPLRGCV